MLGGVAVPHSFRRGTGQRVLLALILGCLGFSALAPGSARGAPVLPSNFNDQLVASLSQPTALAFTPDGRLLITTQPGTLRVYENGALLPTSALNISANICANSERGLLGVAVDPDFANPTNHFIYLYYTFKKFGVCDTSGMNTPVNRVSRFVLGNNNVVDPASETVLIDNIPSPAGNHNGGDLQFGNDGFLYASVGDGGCDYAGDSGCAAANDATRDQFVLVGKVLRITGDGAIPPTNPFQGPGTARCNVTGITSPANKCQETFAWGFRNPFRIAFDPNTSGTRFFINDVGQATWEEIDLGQAGADYGWNVREGPCATGSTTNCGAPPPGMTNPIAWYGHTGGCNAITGGAFVPPGAWPSTYTDVYLYADLGCGTISELRPLSGGGYSQGQFGSNFGANSLVALTFGPSSSGQALYYITYNAPGHQVRRITYNSGYSAPVGASPVRVSLVPAFKPCETSSADSVHGAPLNFQSCSNPKPASSTVRIGSNAIGFARIVVCNASSASQFCNPAGGGLPKPDVRFTGSIRDVKCAPTLPPGQVACPAPGADYNPNAGTGPYTSAGDGSGNAATPPCFPTVTSTTDCIAETDLTQVAELPGASIGGSGAFQGRGVRITDRASGPAETQPATLVNIGFPIPLDCIPTADTSMGSNCGVNTTANALAPGVAQAGDQAVWQLGEIELEDSGPDGVRGNADDELFGVQGIFLP